MVYADLTLAAIVMFCLITAGISLAYNAHVSGTSIEGLYRVSAVVMYDYPQTIWIYLGACIAYIATGAAALYFGMKYFGLSMLILAAFSSYSTAYFYSLHRQMARGIRIL